MPVTNTPENEALHLARTIVDEGPSYPSISPIFYFLKSAALRGLVTLHFELPPMPEPAAGDPTPNAGR